jgi:hypothetical protein
MRHRPSSKTVKDAHGVREEHRVASIADPVPVAEGKAKAPKTESTAIKGIGPLEDSRLWLIAGIFALISGMIHIAISPDHFIEAAGLGLFFLALGSVQIFWSMWHLARPSFMTWMAGIVIAVGAILIYVAALFIRPPFSGAAEPADFTGLFSKFTELVTVMALLVPLPGAAAGLGRSRGKIAVSIILAIVLGLGGGVAAIGAGYGAEIVMPSLSEPSQHHHEGASEDEHTHAEAPSTGGLPILPGGRLPPP